MKGWVFCLAVRMPIKKSESWVTIFAFKFLVTETQVKNSHGSSDVFPSSSLWLCTLAQLSPDHCWDLESDWASIKLCFSNYNTQHLQMQHSHYISILLMRKLKWLEATHNHKLSKYEGLEFWDWEPLKTKCFQPPSCCLWYKV